MDSWYFFFSSSLLPLHLPFYLILFFASLLSEFLPFLDIFPLPLTPTFFLPLDFSFLNPCSTLPRNIWICFFFSAPVKLVSMASECSWCDAVVELQVWCQLAAFCHRVNDHRSVLRCTLSALQLEEVAAHSLNTTPCVL